MIKPILFNTAMVQAILESRKTVTRRPIKYKYSNTEMKMRTDKYGTRLVEIQRDVEGETYGKNEDGSTWHKLRGYIEPKPPYQPGDILYVRETCRKSPFTNHYIYRADGDEGIFPQSYDSEIMDDTVWKWRPSIHMPKEAARIWLKVTDVRVERLQDITEEQAVAEGICKLYDDLSDEEYLNWSKNIGVYPKAKDEWGYKNYLWHGHFGQCGTGNWRSDKWEYQYSSYKNARGSFSSLWNYTLNKSDMELYGWDENPWVWVIKFERCEKPEEE